MSIEGAEKTLYEAFSDKTRTRSLEAVVELVALARESDRARGEIADAFSLISGHDSSWSDISLSEGVRRLRAEIGEQQKEASMLRNISERTDTVLTKCKVALMNDITADHRWHPVEEDCPHARCIALNAIEDIRGGA